MKKTFFLLCCLMIVLGLFLQPMSNVVGLQPAKLVNPALPKSPAAQTIRPLTFNDFGINSINSLDTINSLDVVNRYQKAKAIGAQWNRWPLWFHVVAPFNEPNYHVRGYPTPTPPASFTECDDLLNRMNNNLVND